MSKTVILNPTWAAAARINGLAIEEAAIELLKSKEGAIA